jgi:hypothetical protein
MHHPDDRPTTPPDHPPDETDAQWMTFAELAAARGISRDSAIALVRRKRWRRQRDNRGHTLALVPNDGPELRRAVPVIQGDHPPDDRWATAFYAQALAALEDALTALREAKDGEIATLRYLVDGMRSTVARAEDRATRADSRATEAEVRVVSLEADLQEKDAQLADAAERTDRLEQDLAAARIIARAAQRAAQEAVEQARAEAQTAQDSAAALRQADEARKARGRLRRAWDGWRGR